MPTALPPSTRRVEEKRSLFGVVLNTFMVVSALLLTVMVLVQEQRYAMGQPGPLAGTLANLTQQVAVDTTGKRQVTPPSN